MGFFNQPHAFGAGQRDVLGGAVLLLLGLSISGCSTPTKPGLPEITQVEMSPFPNHWGRQNVKSKLKSS